MKQMQVSATNVGAMSNEGGMQDTVESSNEASPAKGHSRPSLIVRLVRFIAWICVVIGALTLASTVYTFAPCLIGVSGACISGVLLLFGGVFALVFCGVGWLLLALTRNRSRVRVTDAA